ncbi:MAG: hypothetical protein ACR2H5_06480 [Ktedonobacteraceae bacterium]
MNTKQKDIVQQGSRWLRVGVLTLTTVGPMVNTFIARMRQQAAATQKAAYNQEEQRLEAEQRSGQSGLTPLSRQLVAEQARQLQMQARHWQMQAKHLRKALRHESKQRRRLNKMVQQLQKAGVDWGQEMLKRSEGLTGDLVAQGSKLSQDWLERGGELSQDLVKRGGKLTRDLTERGSELSQDLVKRGGKLSHDLADRGSELSQDLVKRGSNLLQPARQRKSTFWTVFGFSLGVVVAAAVTYLFVRKRIVQQLPRQEQQIELPPREHDWNGTHKSQPAGEIRHIDSEGVTVATLQVVGTQQQVAVPADAAFVGVVASKTYYPLETPVDSKDVIYFSSEEEAQAEGFTAAAE